jgi:hypothetical protein
MDLANEINVLLDELSKQIKLGDEQKIIEITNRLNKKTRQGEIVQNIFTNDYYVNNMMLDKREKQMQ